jgi:hypothetical protein
MLYIGRHERGLDYFSDINATAIDDFYYTHLDFDVSSSEAKRLEDILTKLDSLLAHGAHPKMRGHDAIHLVLLIDSLWEDYTRSWEATLPEALDKFSEEFALSKQDGIDDFYLLYTMLTRVASDRGDTIRRRHEFYVRQMFKYLAPLQMKDQKRAFGPLERELIYYRDGKKCSVCAATVPWSEVEIHHVDEHAKGGQTIPENGVLVHRHCHPKGSQAEFFAAKTKNSTQF